MKSPENQPTVFPARGPLWLEGERNRKTGVSFDPGGSCLIHNGIGRPNTAIYVHVSPAKKWQKTVNYSRILWNYDLFFTPRTTACCPFSDGGATQGPGISQGQVSTCTGIRGSPSSQPSIDDRAFHHSRCTCILMATPCTCENIHLLHPADRHFSGSRLSCARP